MQYWTISFHFISLPGVKIESKMCLLVVILLGLFLYIQSMPDFVQFVIAFSTL